MKLSTFKQILIHYKHIQDQLSELHKMGFDFYEGNYGFANQIEGLLKSVILDRYGSDGWNWITWFLFERSS